MVAAALTVAAGLGARAAADGAIAEYAGDALYALLVYLLLVVIAPRARPWAVAAVATGACWAVELAQLTPWPAELSEDSALARVVLGSTFNAPDLLAYAVGAAGGLALQMVVWRGRNRGWERTVRSHRA